MLHISTDDATGVVSIEPQGPLQESDFEQLDGVVDPIIAARGSLPGLLIHTKSFPGWDDFAGFLSHRRFVKEHHTKIGKVALVTDSFFGGIAESLTRVLHLVTVKHFAYADLDQARSWVAAEE